MNDTITSRSQHAAQTLANASQRRDAGWLAFGGAWFVADASGVLFEPLSQTLVVADLHLEKGSALAARGALLPPWDTAATLARLAAVVARLQPRVIVALGDSFHDAGGPDRLAATDRAALAGLQAGRDWIWITGNHDPHLPATLGGDRQSVLTLGDVAMRHIPSPAFDAGAEFAGHLHPAARLRLRGRTLRRRCFVADARRCILPAFGAYAGGLNVQDQAIASLFPDGMQVRVLGEQRVFAAASAVLIAD